MRSIASIGCRASPLKNKKWARTAHSDVPFEPYPNYRW
jgi:hypothetical protein